MQICNKTILILAATPDLVDGFKIYLDHLISAQKWTISVSFIQRPCCKEEVESSIY